MENLRDFIVLHYLTKKENTQFWKDVAALEIPDSLKYRLDLWKNKMPIDEDFSELSDYILFKGNNHAVVMHGLDLFNRSAIKAEYDACHDYIKNAADEIIKERKEFDNSIDKISHKNLISKIRNY
jgi:hypothetical protein